MKLRSRDIFCASQASTAILLTTMSLQQQPSSSSSSTHLGGTRAIDRHNPIIRETTRRISTSSIPCTSDHPLPLAPMPYKQLHHKPARNSTSKKSIGNELKKKSKIDGRKSDVGEGEIGRKSSFGKRGGDFVINGPDSSRYLLGESGLVDLESDFEPGLELVSSVNDIDGNGKMKDHQRTFKTEESPFSNFNAQLPLPPPPPPPPPSPPSSSRSPDQVLSFFLP